MVTNDEKIIGKAALTLINEVDARITVYYDGEEISEVRKSQDVGQIVEETVACDTALWEIHWANQGEAKTSEIYWVNGNGDNSYLTDYTSDLAPLLKPVEDYAEVLPL